MKPAILFVSVVALFSTSLRAQTCAGPWILGVPLGPEGTQANGVSADGSVIVGATNTLPHAQHAFRWTATSGLQELGTLGGSWSVANDVSADGSVAVGFAELAGGDRHAFRWTDAGGLQDIGTFEGTAANGLWSLAYGVSSGGDVVVGSSTLANGDTHAFRWTAAGGMQDLGTFGGGNQSVALATNADGSVVVGWYRGASVLDINAFLWTAANGVQPLGLGGGYSWATDVSADGTVVVGNFVDAFGTVAPFRWTAAGGAQSLVGFGSVSYSAFGVNADGSAVVGSWIGSFGIEGAFRWTTTGGMHDLSTLVGTLCRAHDVSADGSVIVGTVTVAGLALRLQSSVLGETYCRPTVENSTGCGGIVLANGDPRLATGALELTAALLPPNSFGFFLTSQAQDLVLAAGGSQGNLCLGGAIGRFVGPGQVMNSGASGTFTMAVDLNAIPAPTLSGGVAAQPGDTWNFQAWHRDVNPGQTSNFTDAVSITFN